MGGLHWGQSDTQQVINSLKQQIKAIEPAITDLKQAISALQSDIGDGQALSGTAYSKVSQSLESTVMPVITAFADLNDSVQGKISVFQQTDATLQGYGNVLDEAELEANIQSFQKMTSALSSLKRATPIGKSLV